MRSSKSLRFHKGILENAGFGEISYFIKKAKQNVVHASHVLRDTEFEESKEHIRNGAALIADLTEKVSMLQAALENVEWAAMRKLQDDEDKEEERKAEQKRAEKKAKEVTNVQSARRTS